MWRFEYYYATPLSRALNIAIEETRVPGLISIKAVYCKVSQTRNFLRYRTL